MEQVNSLLIHYRHEMFKIIGQDVSVYYAAGAAAIGSMIIVSAILLFVKKKKVEQGRFNAVGTSAASMLVGTGKVAVDRWIDDVSKRFDRKHRRHEKFQRGMYVYILAAIFSFFWTLTEFKNLPAALCLSGSMVVLPSYISHLLYGKREEVALRQLSQACSVYVSEYFQRPVLYKVLTEMSTKVPNPLGKVLGNAGTSLLLGYPQEKVLNEMAAKIPSQYALNFVDLIRINERNDCLHLFMEFRHKLDRRLRQRLDAGGEAGVNRFLGFALSAGVIPGVELLRVALPEVNTFVTDYLIGKILLFMAYGVFFGWVYLDSSLRRTQ